MKGAYLTLVILILASYSVSAQKSCEENLVFKDSFFTCITKLEQYAYNKQHSVTTGEFNDCLRKLGRFVATDKVVAANYRGVALVAYHLYEPEKLRWLQWYEAHKCEGLEW